MSKQLYRTGACTISYNPQVPCIELEWHGYATSPQYRAIAEQQLAAMQQMGTGKVLDDHTHMKMVGESDQRWVMENWLPRALQLGFKACAIIQSKDYFNRLSTQNVLDQIDPGRLAVVSFDDRDVAREWLAKIS